MQYATAAEKPNPLASKAHDVHMKKSYMSMSNIASNHFWIIFLPSQHRWLSYDNKNQTVASSSSIFFGGGVGACFDLLRKCAPYLLSL